MWGFWDGAHWKHNAPLYRNDFSMKPAGRIVRDFALQRWRTNEDAKTDGQGSFSTRAFLGTYEITASAGGKQKRVEVGLESAGADVTIQLD